MKDGKIVAGVVGLQFGLRHLDGFIANGFEVGGICDNLPGRVEQYGTEYKIPEDKWFRDYRDMLNIGLDIVVIAVPDMQHRELSEAFLDAGVNVLCEKPLALTHEDLCAIAKAEARSKARFMTAHWFLAGYM